MVLRLLILQRIIFQSEKRNTDHSMRGNAKKKTMLRPIYDPKHQCTDRQCLFVVIYVRTFLNPTIDKLPEYCEDTIADLLRKGNQPQTVDLDTGTIFFYLYLLIFIAS